MKKKNLLLGVPLLFALGLPNCERGGIVLYAQTLPATLTASWDPQPVGVNAVSHKLQVDSGPVVVVPISACTATRCTATVTVPTFGPHTYNVRATNIMLTAPGSPTAFQDGPVSTLAFTLNQAPQTAPANLQLSQGGSVVPPNLASRYPGDVGIETDPSVVFVERFDEASIAALGSRWGDSIVTGMAFDVDVPVPAPGRRSLQVTPALGGSASHLYKVLSPSVTDTLYVRYYLKHVSGSPDHSGIWMGGSNPASPWPDQPAGTKPNGSDRFSVAVERQASGDLAAYDYWVAMHADGAGGFFGNKLFPTPTVPLPIGSWVCIEQMVKLNATLTTLSGEQAVWVNGVLAARFVTGTAGAWGNPALGQNPSTFTAGTGAGFEGFQWRTASALTLNWIWLQNYAPSATATVRFAHVVAATQYIGPLA